MATHSSKIKLVDLFAGTGAFSYAFMQTGNVEVVFANDMISHSKAIYDLNHPPPHASLTLKDLHDVKVEDIPAHHIITAGMPCQPFSIAGHQKGFKDKRANVFWKIMDIADHHNTPCIIIENVKNLVSHDKGNTFKTIKENLEQRNYYICAKVLNTAKITGVAQHRERIYLVCVKSKELFDEFNLDFSSVEKLPITHFLENGNANANANDTIIPDKYYYTEASSTWNLVQEKITKKDTIYQYRRIYVRENKSNECPTLTANMGSGGHNVPLIRDDKGIRKLTPRECFNFQGFPATYKLPKIADCNLYKLAGNAVSVPVVKLIADRLTPLLIKYIVISDSS